MRQSRAVVAVAAALVLLGAAVAGFWWWREGQVQQQEALAAAERVAAAWDAGDHAALGAATTQPEAAAAAHEQAVEALEPDGVEATVTDARTDEARQGTASAELAVRWDLGALGEWEHTTRLALVADDDGWRAAWEPAVLHPDLAEDGTLSRTRTWPERAPIVDADGEPLAGAGEVVEVGVQPGAVEDADAVAEALGEATDATPQEVIDLLDRDDLEPDWFYEVDRLRDDDVDAVREDVGDVPGTIVRPAPGRELADPSLQGVLGTVEEATAEQLEELGAPYQAGDVAGRRGLERAYERELAGEPGGAVQVRDADGEVVATPHEADPVEPEPLEVTLDAEVQAAAMAALEGLGEDEEAAVVVVDVEDAAVRALADAPAEGFPRSRAGAYPPGSTFKVVTAAALLREGLVPEDPMPCPATTTAGGREITNAGDLELDDATFADALVESCNTAFVDAALDLPEEALAQTARDLGFGDEVTLGGSSVAAEVPDPADEAEAALASIGQARVSAAPVHLASVAAGVASGRWDAPHLRPDDEAPRGEPLDEGHVDHLATMLRAAVEEGTGTAADVDGAQVHGKTGTAEVAEGEHAWFIGWAGDHAFAVLVEEGGAGGEAAAPVAADLVEALEG